MDNNYKQKVDAADIVKYKTFKGLAVMCFIMALLLALLSNVISAAIIAAAGIFSLYYRKFLLVYYYYEISNEEVFIGKSIADKNEKRIFSFNIGDIIIMAPERSPEISKLNVKQYKTLKFHFRGAPKGVYTVFTKSGDKIYKLKMIPDKIFIKMCKNKNKSKVIEK